MQVFEHQGNVLALCRCIQIRMSAIDVKNFFHILHKRTIDFIGFDKFYRNRRLSFDCCADFAVHTSFIQTMLFGIYIFYHSAGGSHIGYTVNENKFTHCLMFFKFIYDNLVCQ